jgi:predicted esterase YcpF (UPF0227 family)
MESSQIVFFHGLESGPGAYKHRWLNSLYGEENVHCIDMEMSLYNIRKANSVSRQLVSNMLTTLPWNLLARSIHSSLNRCLIQQIPQIEKVNVLVGSGKGIKGIVVASSFGGAVATLALARGVWSGPTVLLAPAYGKLSSYGSYNPQDRARVVYSQIGKSLTAEQKKLCCILHGTDDTTIDMQDSIELSELSGIRLVKVEGGTHSLNDHLHVVKEELDRLRSLF